MSRVWEIPGHGVATLEVDLGGLAIWDVSHLLPVNKRRPFYETREFEEVTHLFVHHSGRLGKPGFQGLYNSTRYVVTQKPTNNDRGFPGCAYHLWAPYMELRDPWNRLVCFRANQPETRCWHTGGDLNGFGESLALQGNTTKLPLSPSQEEILEGVIPYRLNHLSLQAMQRAEHAGTTDGIVQPTLSWHSEASRWGGKDKPACPGNAAVIYLTEYREGSDWAGHRVAA